MGRGLQLAGRNPTLFSHPKLTFQKWGFRYLVDTKGTESTYSVTDGTNTIALPIRWTFGKNAQTWVFERDGVYYESLVSYYPSIDGLEVTTGDEGLQPKTLEEAFGRKLGNMETRDCFRCHSSRSVNRGKLDLESLEEGVTCEHCHHQGSSAHMVAAFQGMPSATTPPDLKRLTSEDISNYCGQCHRTWETVVRGRWRGEINVRFQPYRLANSKCFNGTDPRISCIACHNVHQDLVRDTKSYDSKCLACHSSNSMGQANTGATAKACPKGTSDCAGCHMPQVKLPNGLMTFHDHQIRIVKPGTPYPD